MALSQKNYIGSREDPAAIITRLEDEVMMLKAENTKLKKQLDVALKSLGGQKPLSDQAVIERIFSMYLNNASLQDIVDALTREKVETKRGGKWYKGTIKYILENYHYVKMEYVSEDTFLIVQKKLKGNRLGEK